MHTNKSIKEGEREKNEFEIRKIKEKKN